MGQFSKLFPVLVLLTLCKPIVCPYQGHLSYDRRDRVPYIDSREYSTQQPGQAARTIRSLLRKSSTFTDNNANYLYQEQQVEAQQLVSPAVQNQANRATHRNYRNEITKVMAVEKNKRSTVHTNFGPGSHIFDNVNRHHFNSYTNQMIGDQPDPSFEKHFHTPSSGGLSLTKDKVETSTQDHIRKKETGPAYIVDSKDCVDDDAKSGKPFCTRLRNYPEQSQLEEIIKTKFNNLESFFGEDALVPQDINHRNKPAEEFLCSSRTRVVYPEAGLNKANSWEMIINTEDYKQGILVEECINEGSVCGGNTTLDLPNNYKATCKQNFIYRPLVAYENGTIIKDEFKMPCCCKCVLTVS